MADEKKKLSLGGIDDAAAEKGSFMKTIWQLVKFMIVSGLVTIIQLVLAQIILPLIFDMDVFKVAIPDFLRGIFGPNTMFDAAVFKDVDIPNWLITAKQFMNDTFTKVDKAALKAAKDVLGEGFKLMKTQVNTYVNINKYVADFEIANGSIIKGAITWGYLLPFFLSNLIANIYGYIQNKKTTFKSDAPKIMFVIYIFIMIALILFSTWFQGWLFGVLIKVNIDVIANLARTIAALAAGFIQMVFLFPMEKFVLLKEKKPADGEEIAEAEAEDLTSLADVDADADVEADDAE